MVTIAALKEGLGFAGIVVGAVIVSFCLYFGLLARKAKTRSVAGSRAK